MLQYITSINVSIITKGAICKQILKYWANDEKMLGTTGVGCSVNYGTEQRVCGKNMVNTKVIHNKYPQRQ